MPLNGADPEWLNSLGGKSPLLGRSELEYIAQVRRSIIREAESKPSFNGNDGRQLEFKLSTMKNNFAKIVKYLKENSESKEYFLHTYRNWKPIRQLTIRQLYIIAGTINENKRECSASRKTASTVSLIGGLICFATGMGALRLLGASLMGLGTLASAGSSAQEIELLKEKIKEAEKIIEEDRKISVKLWDWMSDVSYIKESLDIIRNIDLEGNLKKAANDLYKQYNKKWCPDDIQKCLKYLRIFLRIPYEKLHTVADIVGLTIATFMLYDRYRDSFNRAFETHKRNLILSNACKLIITSFQLSSAFKLKNSLKLTTLQKSTIITGIVLDVLNIITASDSSESTSKEAEEIYKAVSKLEQEANVFEQIYDSVIKDLV